MFAAQDRPEHYGTMETDFHFGMDAAINTMVA